jgi:hypothetical protein
VRGSLSFKTETAKNNWHISSSPMIARQWLLFMLLLLLLLLQQ